MLWQVRVGRYTDPLGEYSLELRISSVPPEKVSPSLLAKEMTLEEAEKFAQGAAIALNSPCVSYRDVKANEYSFEIPF